VSIRAWREEEEDDDDGEERDAYAFHKSHLSFHNIIISHGINSMRLIEMKKEINYDLGQFNANSCVRNVSFFSRASFNAAAKPFTALFRHRICSKTMIFFYCFSISVIFDFFMFARE
jgi:hypothetical protein